MRRIAIVGGGQAGLPLAFGLLDSGYEVTVVSNRTPDDIRAGKVMSSQCMFDPALELERGLGLNDWEGVCPPIEGIGFSVPHPAAGGAKLIDWKARLERPAQSVDQRVKMSAWLEQFELRGGRLRIQDAGVAEFETLAATHDLVILAAGKGEVVRLFERDASRSPFDGPQRALALTYVHGLEKVQNYSRVSFKPDSRRRRVLRVSRADVERSVRHHGVRGRAPRSARLLARHSYAAGTSRHG
jgi:hypothetical protein